MAEQTDKPDKKRPALTPEQEAEAAAKKAARAEGKKTGKSSGRGKAAAATQALAQDRVRRAAPPRLRKLYETEVRQKLRQEFGLKNVMEVPRIEKITINMGLGERVTNPAAGQPLSKSCRRSRAEAGGHQGEEVDRVFKLAARA